METLSLKSNLAAARKPRVKKLLKKAFIYLSNQNFVIFVTVVAAPTSWLGACAGNDTLVAKCASVFVVALFPWAWREISRELRRDNRRNASNKIN